MIDTKSISLQAIKTVNNGIQFWKHSQRIRRIIRSD